MRVIDLHCDVLTKLLRYPQEEFMQSTLMDVTLERLINTNYLLQVFAIYIPDEFSKTLATFLRVVDLFYSKVLKYEQIHWVKSKEDLDYCYVNNKIGVMISIEGVECLEAKLYMTSIVEQLGIQAIGLTWNNQNWAAEGALANTNTGISSLGKQFLQQLSGSNIILDVSHLSLKSFTDLMYSYSGPIWASHSNSYTVCNHPRNLTDEQIKALIYREGLIGLTYVPQFISSRGDVTIDMLIEHIEYMLKLGGQQTIALGSDFDGIDTYIQGLEQPEDVIKLKNMLLSRFGETVTEGILWKNAYNFIYRHLH